MTENIQEVAARKVDPAKAAQQLGLIREKRTLARRNFLRNVSLAGAGIAAGAMLEGCTSNPSVQAQAVPQTDVLNFALNLEYLEAEFYSVATTGAFLSGSVSGTTGASLTTGGQKVPFVSHQVEDIAYEIASDEIAHVKFLRTALGGIAVTEPAINLNALGTNVGFKTDADFLNLACLFEDTGVSAYAGAATLLSGSNLQAAAQILGTEAYHAGNIRLFVVQLGITATASDSMDIIPSENQSLVIPSLSHFFPTDSNGLALKRTTSQVLSIVYGPAALSGTKKGGFFPNGMNGNINTV